MERAEKGETLSRTRYSIPCDLSMAIEDYYTDTHFCSYRNIDLPLEYSSWQGDVGGKFVSETSRSRIL